MRGFLLYLQRHPVQTFALLLFLAITLPFARVYFFNGLLNFPHNSRSAIELVKSYDDAKYCGRIVRFWPQFLPGDTQQDARDQCYNEAANHFDDIQWCNKIKSEWYRGMCQGGRIPCSEVEHERARNSCYKALAEEGRYELEDCEAEERHSGKAACLEGLAYQANDSKYCDMIVRNQETAGYRNTCYYTLAEVHLDLELCKKITRERSVENCTNEVQKAMQQQ